MPFLNLYTSFILPLTSYLFLSESTNWSDAKNTCEDLNAHLVKIETAEENEELYNEAVRLNMIEVPAWIGLNDIAEEGTWVWADGKRADFTEWGPTQPQGGAIENCVEFNTGFDHPGKKWHDAPCNQGKWAICELNV